jgi:N-acetylmuramoyl-L-alanine amidase
MNKKNRNLPTIYLNAGHGGLHPLTGKYMTNPKHGKFYMFENQGNAVAQEGVLNRLFADRFALEATALGLRVIKVYHPFLDLPNLARLAIANADYLKNKPVKSLWLSFHSNAMGMQPKGNSLPARGFSLFTTDGETPADVVGERIWQGVRKEIVPKYGITLREDRQDGDGDFEVNFDELYFSLMPAVLLENLFFTNWEDFQMLQRTDYQQDLCHLLGDVVWGWASGIAP